MVHGVSKNTDLDPALMQREIRPMRYRIGDFFSWAGGIVTAGLAFSAGGLAFFGYGSLSDLLLFACFVVLMLSRKYRRSYPLRRPMEPGNPDPKTKKPGDGLFLIGNDIVSGETVWISNDDARTHMLCFGSTGSGKTRFLLSLFYQALLVGSGVMYVDGKGDTTVFGLVFSMVRRLGREDDLMIINYLTGSKSGKSEDDGSRLSNTNNPFAYGPAETLRSLIVSLMRDGGGDDMWKGRASALLAAVLQTLVYMRDSGELNMDVGTIRESLPLDRILELAQRDDLPEHANTLLKKYLLELPGYSEEDAISGQLSAKCYEQHGYLTMQLSEVLSELSSTYKHIFDAPLGEVDYKDLVYNRRILFVMLPALEKDPDALSGLGKMVVAGVRSALAPALGEKVEGSHEEVMDAKPTNSNVPFLLIMDEYGYYSVKGFSVVAAQARSLGVSVVFAGQDFPSFKKGSEDEAKSVVANTNVKIFMKLEDQGETLQLAVERGGEADTVQAAGHEMKGEVFTAYQDNLQTRTERKKRINIRDLVSQQPGDAHVMFGDMLFRCKLYFTQPNKSPEYRINKMLMVRAPRSEVVTRLHAARDAVGRLFIKDASAETPQGATLDSGLQAMFNAYDVAITRKQHPVMASQLAMGMMEHQERLLDEAFIRALKGESPEPLQEQSNHSPASPVKPVPKPQASPVKPHEQDMKDQAPPVVKRSAEDRARAALDTPVKTPDQTKDDRPELAEVIDQGMPFMRAPFEPDQDLRAESRVLFTKLSSFINDTVQTQIEDSTEILSPNDQENAQPLNQLIAIERAHGRTEKQALEQAKRSMEILDERIDYPTEPQPERLSMETVDSTLEYMMKQIEKSKASQA